MMWIRHMMAMLVLGAVQPALAQQQALLQQLKAANTSTDMCYRYRILLVNTRTNRISDSMNGFMFVKDGQYTDSSTYAYTARVGNYYCRLDHKSRKATVSDIVALSKRMGVRIGSGGRKDMFNMSDSLIARHGSYVIEDTDPHQYRFKLRLKNYPVSYVQIAYDKATLKMTEAYYESLEKNPDGLPDTYLCKMQLMNIRSSKDMKMPALSSIFTLNNGKILLNKKYASYQLIPVQ